MRELTFCEQAFVGGGDVDELGQRIIKEQDLGQLISWEQFAGGVAVVGLGVVIAAAAFPIGVTVGAAYAASALTVAVVGTLTATGSVIATQGYQTPTKP